MNRAQAADDPASGRFAVDSGLCRATNQRRLAVDRVGEESMKYLCMVHFEEEKLEALSEGESESLADESLAYDEELIRSGHLVLAHALQRARTATILRVRNGKLSATDGPFAETNEQLGRFILIDADDLNDAIQVAAKIPLARLGTIEVRPIMSLV
jgi:hypothetical protein